MNDLSSYAYNNQFSSPIEGLRSIERLSESEEGNKTVVTYSVKMGARSVNVTVGFTKANLERHFAEELHDSGDIVSVIDKIVNNLRAEELIKLTGQKIVTNLRNVEETQIETLQSRNVSSFTELQNENPPLAQAVEHVFNVFQKSEVGGLVNEMLREDQDLESYGETPAGQNRIEGVFNQNIHGSIEQAVTVEVEEITRVAELPQLVGAEVVSPEDPYKNIVKEWTYSDGKEIHTLTERIDRCGTGDRMREIALKELEFLRDLGCFEGVDKPQEEEVVKERIKLLTKIIEQEEDSWASSNFFRDMLRGDERLNSKSNAEGIRGAVEAYTEIMNDRYYTRPYAVNMRYHSCETHPNQKITDSSEIEMQDLSADNSSGAEGWLRAGVISCMDNGFVNQQQMDELKNALEEEDLDRANELRNAMAKEILKVWRKESKKNGTYIDASAGYALTQLGFDLNTVARIGDEFHGWTKRGFDTILNIFKIKDENIETIRGTVNKVVKKRNDLLANQFLQLVMEQLERATPEELNDGLKLIHVGLLNHHSRSVDKTGWYHNEEQEMQDMAYIMSQFDNTNMVCDGTGPYIDVRGVIHLPQLDHLENRETVNLRSVYVNQSVQGSTKNDGAQEEINGQALEKLREIDEVLADNLEEIFNKEHSGYTTAADVVNLIKENGYKVSTGCLSAKDRTGGVSLLVTDRVMDQYGYPDTMRRRVRRKQLLSDSPNVLVVRDNTETKVMKITPLILEGISDRRGGIKGIATRVMIYEKQGWELYKESKRIAKKFKH